MSLLVNIPWDVSQTILTEWTCSVKQLGLLDIALGTSSAFAENYRNLLRQVIYDSSEDNDTLKHGIQGELFNWMCKRKLKLTYLFIDKWFCQAVVCCTDLTFPTSSVCNIDLGLLESKWIPTAVGVINSCTRARHLNVTTAVLNFLSPEILAHIDSLYIGTTGLLPNDIENIKHCSLKTLIVSSDRYDFRFQDHYTAVIANSPNLVSLRVCAKATILPIIVKCCPLIESIELKGSDKNVDMNDVVNAVVSLPKLSQLIFSRGKYEVIHDHENTVKRTFDVYFDENRPGLDSFFLKIHPAVVYMVNFRVSHELVQSLIDGCGPVLTELEINARDLAQEDIVNLLHGCPQLTYLNVCELNASVDVAVMATPNQISRLDIVVGSFPSIIGILRGCQHLRKGYVFCDNYLRKDDLEEVRAVLLSLHAQGRTVELTVDFWNGVEQFKDGEYI